MKKAPIIKNATIVKKASFMTDRHTAILLKNIEAQGTVEYNFIFAVFENQASQPCIVVTSEVNTMAFDSEAGSHLLCLFSGDLYKDFGASSDWADIEKFEIAAVELAAKELKRSNEDMSTEVIDYLNSVGGQVLRSPSNRIWYKDPSDWEKEWDRLSRDNACVYDFPATSSLFRYLIETSEVNFIDPVKSKQLNKGIRNQFLESDSRILHQLILHDKIYLNITNLIKENVNFEILKDNGIATEYPRALSKEFLGVYIGLKPLIMEYIEKLLRHARIDDFSMFWRSGIYTKATGQRQQFLSYAYDEYAKLRCGEESYFLSLLDLFTPEGNIRIGDIFEAAMDGLSPMLHDSMHMFTLAPQVNIQKISSFSQRHVADDTVVLFQLALGEEVGFTPRIESLKDVLRFRNDKRVRRYREVLSKFIHGIRDCDESIVQEMGQEIRQAKKYLNKFEWMDSRPYLWATTAAGFVPILGQIVGGATVVLKEVRELVEKRHNWIYLGCK